MWASLVYAAVLFYLLTPGVLVSLPPGGSRTTVAVTHAVAPIVRLVTLDADDTIYSDRGSLTADSPVIPLIYALQSKLEDIRAEGVEARYARHARLNKAVRDWALAKGFTLFPKDGYGSVTLNCFNNNLGYDLSALNKILKAKHHLVIDGGYGKLKGKAFRISNMGDETDATIAALLQALDSALAETPKLAV